MDTLKSKGQGLCWCPVPWLSFLKTCNLKSSTIKCSYLVRAHLQVLTDGLVPSTVKRKICPVKMHEQPLAVGGAPFRGRPEDTAPAARNLSSRGGGAGWRFESVSPVGVATRPCQPVDLLHSHEACTSARGGHVSAE